MIQTSEQLDQIAGALVQVQGIIEGAKKDSVNPFHKSKYADLSSVWEACREPLTKNGISVVQATGYRDGVVYITTMLLHVSGQWIRDELGIRPKEDTPQGVGSAITYGRRYGLSAMVGVSPEDDDGESAQGRGGKAEGFSRSATASQAKAAFKQAVNAGTIVTPKAV